LPNGELTEASAAQFGELDIGIDSPLLSTRYGSDAGPGILVWARDSFRLYVNGELLAESTRSMQPQFVGYSFLPGLNTIAVLARGAARAPLVAVRVDELERTLVSDAQWKVSDAPGAGWTRTDFDDNGWRSVRDFGRPDPTTDCGHLLASFNLPDVHLIGDFGTARSNLAFRYSFVVGPTGFGAATTGGNAGTFVLANDVATFRNAVGTDDSPRVVAIDEGLLDLRLGSQEIATQTVCPRTCTTSNATEYVAVSQDDACDVERVSLSRNSRQFKVRSNKTLVGLGRGALLRGASLDMTDSTNVVLRNVAVFDVNPGLIEAGDGVTLNRSSRVWIDHCTFKFISDGFVDLLSSNLEVTLSWLKFDGQNPAECRARHLRSSEIVASDATYHHCVWQHVDGRAPLAHGAQTRVHLYNNAVMDDVDYAVGSGCQAQVLVEGSWFESTSIATLRRDCNESPGEIGLIRAPAGSNHYDATSNVHRSYQQTTGEPNDAVFAPPYPYSLDAAEVVRATVPTRAGVGSHWALPLPE
jgi:pectate lyase